VQEKEEEGCNCHK